MKKIVLVVGPSGAGKTTLMEKTFLHEQILRSVTTRKKRPNEEDGIDYIFKEKKEVVDLIDNNQILQHVEYNGNYYGISLEEINKKLEEFTVVTAAVVFESIKQFQDYVLTLPQGTVEIIPVFTTITKENLLKHFENRSESEEEKVKRISLYEKEIKNEQYFKPENIINMNINDDATSASASLSELVYMGTRGKRRLG